MKCWRAGSKCSRWIYISVDDLQARSKVSKAVIEMLEQAGSLKELPASSQMTLF